MNRVSAELRRVPGRIRKSPFDRIGRRARDRAIRRHDPSRFLPQRRPQRAVPPIRALPNLKLADTAAQVTAIRHCGDAYRVMTADRKVHTFWEFNLRFKTCGSPDGPRAGKPVIVGTGMQGDRAAVVFARPDEIPAFIRTECP